MDNEFSFIGEEEIISPQLIYYKDYLENNIRTMIELAGNPERLWPHVKTHKMIELVRLQMSYGIHTFKCATIAEAEMCGMCGADKVLLAYPLIGPNIERFMRLMEIYPDTVYYAIGDNTRQIELLGKCAVSHGTNVSVLMDVDMGQRRTGVPFDKVSEWYGVWAEIEGIKMCGLHCYDGHRHEEDFMLRDEKTRNADEVIKQFRESLRKRGLDCSLIIAGGTPSFPCHQKNTDFYLSPGTCVVQDAGYQRSYRDMVFVPGAAVLTRVISHPGPNRFTTDMGTKAVASDPSGERAYIAGMEYAKTVLQNEEHWVLEVPDEMQNQIPPIGTVLYAVPVHICPTTALYPEVLVVSEGKIYDWWKVTARNRKITV